MPTPQTILSCSQRTATIVFILIGVLFLCTGCAALYRAIGLTEKQTDDQVAADQDARTQIIEGIRLTTTELITSALAGLGAIATGFLTKWLGTERKMTKAMITGIENSSGLDVKANITAAANEIGIESTLNKRVKALT